MPRYFDHDESDEHHSGAATLYTLFLPLKQNDGREMPQERLNEALGAILQQAGGLTRLSPGTGFWMNPALQLFRDAVIPIQVVVASNRVTEEWFAQWAAETAALLEQQRIFVFAQPVKLIDALPLSIIPAAKLVR